MLSARPTTFTTDTPYFPAKTPGRAVKNNRAENAHAGLSMTTTRRGLKDTAPKTPFQSSTGPHHFKDQKTILMTTTRVLGDKTPLPNRLGALLLQTPAAQKESQKLSKLSFIDANVQNDTIDEGSTPPSSHRPSSMRHHSKLGRKSNSFQTPANQGRHWDVSDGDIVLEAQPQIPDAAAVVEEDNDSVEYCPPNTLDVPFCPPIDFELPDYAQLGKDILRTALSTPYWDIAPPPIHEITEFEALDFQLLPQPSEAEISDDPFIKAQREIAEDQKPKPLPKSNKPEPKLRARPQSALAKPALKPPVRPTAAPKITRPATAASVYPASASSTTAPKPTARPAVKTAIRPLARDNSTLSSNPTRPVPASSTASQASRPGPATTVRRTQPSSVTTTTRLTTRVVAPPPKQPPKVASNTVDPELGIALQDFDIGEDFVFDA